MNAEFVEGLRKLAVGRLHAMSGFEACWPIWRVEIERLTNDFQSADGIYDLGSNLRAVFRLTASVGRDQGSLSGGGAAWEGLVCWYLNLVLTGTSAVVAKQSRALIPPALADAVSVNYNSSQTNTESDLSGIVFPTGDPFLDQPYNKADCDAFVAQNLARISLHNIQCKTNWNDNAQIPMLWDMVYRARGFRDSGVSVGRNGRSIADLRNYSYSFVTLPSQNSQFASSQMAVKRVAGLSGRNFWGLPTASGVAWSISEMFKHVFGDEVIGDVRGHIQGLIRNGAISL